MVNLNITRSSTICFTPTYVVPIEWQDVGHQNRSGPGGKVETLFDGSHPDVSRN